MKNFLLCYYIYFVAGAVTLCQCLHDIKVDSIMKMKIGKNDYIYNQYRGLYVINTYILTIVRKKKEKKEQYLK
jgi:hypothetical protein